ncbi:DUF3574 domain-containing protein [Cupriavidus oxalaticus]|uniref:DUF3574 domain-containing protein n=2 Tax=Cupriavidus oxalaticus TaxID=96344 RepID=A0A375FNZ3_9BURK|nr:DUF3574 domain-containing protein [Cupriavidus oxalaticus]WQD84916.1 DUF3574 domain-containing protein [Cupriavidus oxalaticus]SPC09890.1 conserved exported hypothetical protein [Cupriavidus oxalaticus]SPC24327.1 conserved exported hypothetical protein [Cupriavidus oxalaticus]
MRIRCSPWSRFGNAIVIALALAFPLSGCVAVPAPACAAGEQAAIGERLYFGMAKPGGTVSEAEWDAFVQDSVAPRFPDGFTAWPASGQWRGADGKAVSEATRVLSLVHAPDERSEAAVRAIASEYKTRFRQEAVLRVRSHVCMSF